MSDPDTHPSSIFGRQRARPHPGDPRAARCQRAFVDAAGGRSCAPGGAARGRRPRLGAAATASGTCSDHDSDERRPDHDSRAVHHRHCADLHHHRSHAGRAWHRRLPHGGGGRGAERAALVHRPRRFPPADRTGDHTAVRAVHGRAGSRREQGRAGALCIQRGSPTRRRTCRVARCLQPARDRRQPLASWRSVRVRVLRRRRQDCSRARFRAVLRC